MESPFDVLRIDPGADDEAVKRAYRARVKEAHPDQGGSVEEFRAVRRAYERIEAGYERNGDGAAADEDGDAEPEPDPVSDERVNSEITYLNYDVLADFGWRVDDDDLFGKAADADIGEDDYGSFEVEPGESLLEGAEDAGLVWPFACRGGACANCAVLLLEGELSMPVSHVLPEELMDQGFRLTCNGMPITDELKVVYNVKHMPELDDLLLPPDPYEQAYPDQ